jgi:hypothetical protein
MDEALIRALDVVLTLSGDDPDIGKSRYSESIRDGGLKSP